MHDTIRTILTAFLALTVVLGAGTAMASAQDSSGIDVEQDGEDLEVESDGTDFESDGESADIESDDEDDS